MRIIKHKKAIGTSLIVDFWSLVIFLVVFLIVYIAIIAGGNVEYGVCVEKIKEDRTMEMLNVLRTPISVEGKTMEISEYLAMYDAGDLDADEVQGNIVERLKKVGEFENIFCMSFDFLEKERIVIAEGGLYKISSCEGSVVAGVVGSKSFDGKKVAEAKFPSSNKNTITAANYVPKAPIISRIGQYFANSWAGNLMGMSDPCVSD